MDCEANNKVSVGQGWVVPGPCGPRPSHGEEAPG